MSLSPRGDWRMPSDASKAAWLRELDEAWLLSRPHLLGSVARGELGTAVL